VVFRTIDGADHEEDLIKRVVGVAGDTVSVDRGIATVNGSPEDPSPFKTSPYDPTSVQPLVVKVGEVFVMGDNRPVSLDSRDIGAIPVTAIKGRAVFLFAPFYRMQVVQ